MRCVCLFFVPFLAFFWPGRWLFRDGLFPHTERRNWPVHYIFWRETLWNTQATARGISA
uniref:Uncharacterized protein n=2 Tax=unclassified Caudoviricetes TaxID=2788787 RepID=A0A8S5ULI6_9CAUD|nr:MAG TPA: hypothetical protein [Siphoviridae sp. ctEQg15]DAF95258.1 MAG TPA: hypothetical protein [Siphoviridae sp. ctOH142]